LNEVIKVLEDFAPPAIAAKWDNIGLLLGHGTADVRRVLLALDVTDAVVAEALELGVCAIISHHPLMRDGVKSISDKTPFGRRFLTLAENKIAVYSAHTNLDFCTGGVNDQLFDILELQSRQSIAEYSPDVFVGRAGTLANEMCLSDFAVFVQKKLGLPMASYCGDGAALVRKVGVVGGGGAKEELFQEALDAGCDTFITSDVKYSAALSAADMGLNLIDATHYATEMVFTNALTALFREKMPNLEVIVTKINGQVVKVSG